jgi:uncharacterized Zn finger protein (UPF0148 family)
MLCDLCGGPLECFEGEPYCPDCTRYEAMELARQADNEARAMRLALVRLADVGEGPADDALPF